MVKPGVKLVVKVVVVVVNVVVVVVVVVVGMEGVSNRGTPHNNYQHHYNYRYNK